MLLVIAQFCVFFSVEKMPQAASLGNIATGLPTERLSEMIENQRPSPLFGLVQDQRFAFLLSLGLIPVASRACAGLAVLSLRSMKTSQYAEMNGVTAAFGTSPEGAELKTEGVADLSVSAKTGGAADALANEREKELASELALRKKQHARFRAVLAVILILAAAVPALLFGVVGLAPAAAAIFYWLFALIAYKNLDGMNGDISGFALTLGELFGAAVLVFVQSGFAQRTIVIG